MNIINKIKHIFTQINYETEQEIANILFKQSLNISVVESCTGGLVSSRLTDISGSSLYITENYITYSNEAKAKILGVQEETLNKYGAVSEECAIEMAEGLFKKLNADGNCDICLSTTGLAGPSGATEYKNIGLMFIGIKNKNVSIVKKVELNPKCSRKKMKLAFSQKALEFLLDFLIEYYV